MTGPDKLEPAFLQVLRDLYGEICLRHWSAGILNRLAAAEAPCIGREILTFCLHVEINFRSCDRSQNLGARPNDARVLHEPFDIGLVKLGDTPWIELGKCLAELIALAQDGDPRKPSLEALEHQHLPQHAAVMLWHTPFLVVIGLHQRIMLRPGTANQLSLWFSIQSFPRMAPQASPARSRATKMFGAYINMARPYWSGHLRISLVSFGIQLFPATEAKGEIHFHQLDRKTGERIKHQNVSTDQDPLDKDDIVKGYEYTKGKYVVVEQEDIDNLRIASRETLEVTQFISQDELDPKFYERPYFVTPEDASQAEAFAVVRKALEASGKVALGKIAFGGREHLVAIAVPADDSELGMMAYTLRYEEELRKPAEYFGDIKRVAIDEDQLALAKQLIQQKSSAFKADKFTDEYETSAADHD